MRPSWPLTPLKQLAGRIFVGIACAATHAYRDSGVLLLRNQNIRDGRIDLSDLIFIDPEFESRHLRKRLRKNDVLIVRTGYTGTAAVVPAELDGCQCFTCLVVRPDADKVDSRFLALFLNSPLGTKDFAKSEAGGSQKNVNASVLEQLSVPVPPLKVQSSIADAVEEWDRAIHLADALCASRLRSLELLAHQLLSEKQRRLRGVPVWPTLRADGIFETVSSKGHPAEPLLSVTQDRGVVRRDALEGRVTMPNGSTAGFKLVEPGQFVISLRSFQGGLEYSTHRGLVSPAYTVLRPVRAINDRFYRHYLRSPDFIKHLSVAVVGIRDGRQVSFRDFSSVKLPHPPVEEQGQIAMVLDLGERELELLQRRARALALQKRGLLQRLLHGHSAISSISKKAEDSYA